jgi:predicted acylesterase/phospholipase RssA
MLKPARLLAIALLFAPAAPAHAREALVLSGGGARGLAHVGAVTGYERRGHDADIVVGTSMGSIVGAFYAAGYSPAVIDEIIRAEDWREIFTPFPAPIGPSRALRYPVLRLQTAGGRSFATPGYVPDWRINRKLTRFFFGVSARARGDFDRLPRRFRSMTADLEDGTLLPLATGDLARAVRASMAAAGFFAPVKWRERLLTDGGIADYLPVDEARHLGADRVIAVDVLRPATTLPNSGAIAVARRSVELLTIRARREEVPPDVLILPRVGAGLAPYDYPLDPSPVIDAGLQATLEAIAADPTSAPASARRLPDPEPIALGALTIDVPAAPLGAFLGSAFAEAAPAPYHEARILRIVDRLYATGLFDGVWPSVEESTLARGPTLVVRTEDRGPVALSAAIGYDNDRGGRLWTSLRHIGVAGTHPIESGLEVSFDGIEQWVAAPVRMARRDGNAWTAGAWFGEAEAPFFNTETNGANPEVRRVGGWLGFETRRIDPDVSGLVTLRAENIDADSGPEGGAFGVAARFGRTAPLVPVIGTSRELSADIRWGAVEYWTTRVKGSFALSLGPVTAAPLADVACVAATTPLDAIPAMGDEGLIPGLRWGERRGRLRAVGGLDLAAVAPFNATLRLRLRGGVVADEARATTAQVFGRDRTWLGGVGLGSMWWTPFGKVEVGIEGSTRGDRRAVISLGPDF